MWPGWTPQIGNIGRKQIEELVNKFPNENPKSPEVINENQNKKKGKGSFFLNIKFKDQIIDE